VTIRTILVNIEIDTPPSPLLRCAIDLAGRFGATLIGVCAAEPSATYVGLDGGTVAAEWYGEERRQIEEQLTDAAAMFRSALPAGLANEFRTYVDTPTRCVVSAARAADLIVLGAQTPPSGASYARSVDAGEVILTAGRPVLIPGIGVSEIMADKIVVGWKDTREARRAASDALPLLMAAKDVRLVAVDEGDYEAEQASLDDAVAWLKRHGVAAQGEIRSQGDGASVALESAAMEFGADLIVTGGYGHSRMRELLFGGVTRELLRYRGVSRFVSN
jgi:nucleotide-binding universal stress UspA family protein